MSSNNPALLGPITVTTANHHINWQHPYSGSPVSYSANITVGVYADINAVIAALGTAMHAQDAGFATSDISIDTSSSPCGRIKFHAGVTNNLKMQWTSADTIGSLLGFVITSDDTANASAYITSDYQAPGAWFATRSPSGGTRYWPSELVGGEQRRTLSGTHDKQVDVATRRSRKVEFSGILPECMITEFATGVNTNRAFESFWNSYRRSSVIRYCADQTDLATYVSCYMTSPTNFGKDVKDMFVDCHLYSFGLGLDRQET